MNISSAIIRCKDASLVQGKIENIEGCEVHLVQNDVIIISIEANSVAKEVDILKTIEKIDGVVDVNMHYSYSQDELENDYNAIIGGVPKVLEDDSDNVEDLGKYSGSVYNQMAKKG